MDASGSPLSFGVEQDEDEEDEEEEEQFQKRSLPDHVTGGKLDSYWTQAGQTHP